MSWSTRDQALEAISNCTSQEEIFEIANKALGSVRREWGDDFNSCAELAYLWSTAAFPVASKTQVDVYYVSGNKEGVSGQRLIEAGLEASKVLAVHLLSPCADRNELNKLVGMDLLAKLDPIAHELVGPDTKGVSSIHLLCGVQATLHSRSASLRESVASAGLQEWSDLDQHLSPSQVQAPWSDEEMDSIMASIDALPKAPDDIFAKMVQEAGFSFVRCGPAGGMQQAKQMALGVFNASKALASHVGIAHKDVGLDGLYCAVNTFGGHAFASCDKIGRGLVLGRPPGALGHEWVHAMEDWVDDRSNNKSLQEDLSRLRAIAIAPPQDAQACQKWLDENRDGGLQEVLGYFIEEKGNTKAKALMAHEGGVPSILSAQIKKDLDINASSDKVLGNVIRTLEGWRAKEAPPINTRAVAGLVKEQLALPARLEKLTSMMEQGKSLFEIDAYSRDMAATGNYWSSPLERLARAAEAHFSTPKDPILGYLGKGDTSSPHGKEFQAVDEAFREFNGCLSLAINKTGLERRLQARRAQTIVQPAPRTMSMS